MSLDAALSIAGSGLAAVQGQIAVVSQNVANANTAGYTEEVAPAIESVAGSQPDGVRLGTVTRVTTPFLQNSLYLQNAQVSYQTVTSNALTAITSVEGSTDSSTGSTGSLTSYLSDLQSNLINLEADTTSSAEQQSVLQSATQLADGINSLASTYSQQLQSCGAALTSNVRAANADLTTIGDLSNRIVTAQAMGQSTASLEDQRQQSMTDLSSLMSVNFTELPSGAMSVMTTSGVTLPTDGSMQLSYVGPNSSTGTAAQIVLQPVTNASASNSLDVTTGLTGGAIGANLQLITTTIPEYQSQLDCFAGALATRFSTEGLPLFSDGSGNSDFTSTPVTGLSSVIQVASSASTLTGLSSAATLSNVNAFTFGADQANGTQWPEATAFETPVYDVSGTPLSELASGLLTAQGADSQTAQTNLSDATALQSSLSNQVSSVTSVSIDSEMSKMVALQNSYQANAKVVSAIQSMYTALLDAISP